MIKKTLIIIGSFLGVFLYAQSPVHTFTDNHLHRNANISILVKDLQSGRIIHSYRPGNAAIPASTVKVITTATALELLGADYRFKTTLEVDGAISADSVLNGNLIIYGSGDPTLGSAKLGNIHFLNDWFAAIKKRGIKRINGNIIANASAYDIEGINPKWLWEDMGNYFAAGAYGISYKDNLFEMTLRSGAIGTTPQITGITPDVSELMFDNYLKSTSIAFDSAYFYGAPLANHRTIHGSIPANRSSFKIKGDIPRPALLLAQDLAKRLRAQGISLTGNVTDQMVDRTIRGVVIYTHLSPKLSEIVNEINLTSNNHYAEHLLRHLGLQKDKPASTIEALRRIKTFWQSKGLPVDELFQVDGSGLSPINAVSANFFVSLLSYMDKSPNSAVFRASLPIAGQSGSLRNFLRKTPLSLKIEAKSGYISRVRAYAGYINTDDGKKWAFAVIVNNPNATTTVRTKEKIEEFLTAIIR